MANASYHGGKVRTVHGWEWELYPECGTVRVYPSRYGGKAIVHLWERFHAGSIGGISRPITRERAAYLLRASRSRAPRRFHDRALGRLQADLDSIGGAA